MKNIVVTGMGIVSCIGSGIEEVLGSLRKGKSGISKNSIYEEMGFRSHVSGSVNILRAKLLHNLILKKVYGFLRYILNQIL